MGKSKKPIAATMGFKVLINGQNALASDAILATSLSSVNQPLRKNQ